MTCKAPKQFEHTYVLCIAATLHPPIGQAKTRGCSRLKRASRPRHQSASMAKKLTSTQERIKVCVAHLLEKPHPFPVRRAGPSLAKWAIAAIPIPEDLASRPLKMRATWVPKVDCRSAAAPGRHPKPGAAAAKNSRSFLGRRGTEDKVCGGAAMWPVRHF